ncbi:MAG: glycosyltransferase [Marinilabiliaceae bacterium]|nr:glycosyltransferase [Marinilabiliaceae bacterium]
MKKTIVISPSGYYYGSEQMLHEHLIYSEKKFKVFVKSPGSYFDILNKTQLKHKLVTYSSTKLLYLKVLFLFFFKGYQSLYVNEGGHIRFVKLLAKIYKSKKFIVHIRLVEDTKIERLKDYLPSNIQLICVSKFIEREILNNNPNIKYKRVTTVHDYYITNEIIKPIDKEKGIIKVGIIGRVSTAKGVSKAMELLNYWDKNIELPIEFFYYGDVIDDSDVLQFKDAIKSYNNVKVYFKGFTPDKEAFFRTFDIVIHFNAYEPFPRIYFDSMARLKPVLGFDSGGIGEQARIFGFERNLIKLDKNWQANMSKKITEVSTDLYKHQLAIYNQRELFNTKLKVETYINSIESYF